VVRGKRESCFKVADFKSLSPQCWGLKLHQGTWILSYKVAVAYGKVVVLPVSNASKVFPQQFSRKVVLIYYLYSVVVT
jgi:hypothetical protein